MRDLLSNLNFLRRLGAVKSLLVRIYTDKFDSLHTGGYHAVDRISTAAANANYFYLNDIVKVIINFKRH